MTRRLTGLAAVPAFCCLLICKTVLAGLPCPYCHAEFHSRGELKEHIRTAHPDAKRSGRLGYRCRHCGKVFQTPAHGIHHERECPMRGTRKKDAKPECPDASKGSKPDTKPDREKPEPRTSKPRVGGVSPVRAPAQPGDVVVALKNGGKFVGTILSRTDTRVELRTREGATMTFPMDQVKAILDHKGKPVPKAGKGTPAKKGGSILDRWFK